MNVSYRWLQDLIDGLGVAPQGVADRLAMLGAPVDEVVDLGSPLRDIVIARVVAAEQHPNADRLRLCTVDAGTGETLQVVCGAPNVTAGSYYPFAAVGASLPDGMRIRKAKIRGAESQGMLCSARELGLGRDHEGILELHGDFEPGRSFSESIGLDDARLVVDVTPNRPDLLSHVGVARELAAAEGLRVALPPLPGAGPVDLAAAADPEDAYSAAAGGVSVRIEDPDLCPHYMAVIVRDVRIGPSPEWLAGRLRAIGLRPISNIVDATNYVLHELGHPMHAFDLDRLGDAVVVRRARAGERITTLDGAHRPLGADMLVIADAERPVAVAGVMGGADTEVHDDTRNILLEIAVFEPRSVRATRRALGLSTDASYRFERGVDPAGIAGAAARAASIIRAVAGGSIEATAAFAGATLPDAPTVRLRLGRIAQVLGVPFDAPAVRSCLEPLGFAVAADGEGAVSVRVPGHRRFDVAREEDLIEEIARRHGYDEFPAELRPFRPSVVPTHPLFLIEDRLRSLLVGRGMLEAHTAAFAPAGDGDVELLMPLAVTESRLRRSLVPGLLRRVESNFARGARTIRLFEIGTTFAPAAAGGLPVETTRLAIACTGHSAPPHWSRDPAPFDVWDLKGLAADVARALGISIQPGSNAPHIDPDLSFRLAGRHDQVDTTAADAGRPARADGGGTAAPAVHGYAGRVLDASIDAPAWADDVWVLEVALPQDGGDRAPLRVAGLPQHPAIERDLALLVGADRPASAVEDAIRSAAGALLESVDPFDVYSGKGVPENVRSIAWRLRFRAPDRTLTDAEVDAVIANVLVRLNDDLGVQQRA
jgi:phenylalanyl-tRNA synthetase beta chain